MRVGTLFAPETEEHLAKQFVLVVHNQLPELYVCDRPVDGTNAHYANEHMAVVKEGAGGGNVRSFFCTPDGRVIHYLAGYWKPRRYLAAAEFAAELLGRDQTEVTAAHQAAAARFEAQRDDVLSPEEAKRLVAEGVIGLAKQTPETKRKAELLSQVRSYNRLIRSHHEAIGYSHQPIDAVLSKIEKSIYEQGALG